MGENISEILDQLDDPDESLRIVAVERLGYSHDEIFIDPLIKALQDSARSVAETAADSLLMIGTEKVAEAISPLLAREESALRNDAVEILTQLKETAVPSLIKSLKDEDHDVRQFAVDALLKIHSPRSLSPLKKLIGDSNENVAASAIEALGEPGNEAIIPSLLKQLDRSPWIKGSCLRSLGKIGGEKALNVILNQVNETDPLILLSVIQALGQTGSAKGMPILLHMLQEKTEMYGEAAIDALESILSRHTEKERHDFLKDISPGILYNIAESGDLSTRLKAIELLGDFKHDSPLEFLLQLYSDNESEIRHFALKAVIQLDPPDITPLANLLQSPQTQMEAKAGVLDTLGQLKHPDGLPSIVSFLESEDITLQRVALNALYPTLDTSTKQKLVELLTSHIIEIRLHTLNAIEQLQDSYFIEPVIQTLHDEDEEIREASDDAFVAIADQMESFLVPFLNSFDQEERRVAFKYFGTHSVADIEPKLLEGLKSTDSQLKMLAIKALVNTQSTQLAPLIVDLLQDENENVVATVIWALGELKSIEHRKLLENFLQNTKNDRYIFQAIVALGQMKAIASLPLIESYLIQKNVYLSSAAAEALELIGNDEAYKILQKTYDQESRSEIRPMLSEILASRESAS